MWDIVEIWDINEMWYIVEMWDVVEMICVISVTAIAHLDKVKVWGKNIRVTQSKHTLVQMPKEGQPVSIYST